MTTETVLPELVGTLASLPAHTKETIQAYGAACARTALQSPECAQWADASNGHPYGEGQYVVRINKHGHIRLGQRVLNSDTLRHQWQVDGEICKTVTHYLPIPALTIKELNHDH